MIPVLDCSREACSLSGAATVDTLDELSGELLEQAASRLEDLKIDLERLTECDSAFVALLMACLQVKKKQNNTLVLVNCPEKLVSLFNVYGLSECGLQV